ncbi:uncharacterized protein LOC129944927 [Eupeodes corollae]|uniref:uncharacterized protein LOC129944927 n=1 Tax=Eupeodes corollae TaxID=290404 RepID=UPI0024937B51|nr:uncharacterized protein LOC129944927 [Eupeodes corollae]
MTKHPNSSKGYLKTTEARQKFNHQWTNLSHQLNAEGPPQRDTVGWKKVWADFKVHTKAKVRRNKINLSGTGGDPPKYNALTPLQEKVAELLDLGQAIEGMTGSLSFGVVKQNNGKPSHLDNEVTSDLIVENEVRGIENLSGEEENTPANYTKKTTDYSLGKTSPKSNILMEQFT